MVERRGKRNISSRNEEPSSQQDIGGYSQELVPEDNYTSEISGPDSSDGNEDAESLKKYTDSSFDESNFEDINNEKSNSSVTESWRNKELRTFNRDKSNIYHGAPIGTLNNSQARSASGSQNVLMSTPTRSKHKTLDSEAMPDLTSNAEFPIDIVDIRGPLDEWVLMEGPRQAIRSEFKHFLTTYINDQGESVYGERVKAMCEANHESLEVSYKHLAESKAHLAFYVVNSPAEVLKIFNSVALEVVLTGFEEYANIKDEIHVRITDLPILETIRDLRLIHINTLVRLSGIVTRRSSVFPQLRYAKYDCSKCGFVMGPYYQDVNYVVKVPNCTNCLSKGPFTLNSQETVYRNYQKITLQESPGSTPAGRLPRHKEVICLWDLVDSCRPGEEIEVTGIYRNNYDISLNVKHGFPVFATVIEANYIKKIREGSLQNLRMTDEDHREILKLSKDPNIVNRIIKSMVPSIYGLENVKTALALSIFGGVFKNPKGKHRIRGDINVLLVGDPGTAKSQFLKYTEKTAHRAIYTTGQGASAVGLTASVRKDPVTREWSLEGGALVMADRGVCLIDEFDKMSDKDRTSIHEAMEQQSISVSKAGIVTTLQARCAIIAAANPVRGRYDPQIPLSQNLDLSEPILSRFDILCVLRDVPNPLDDERLAEFVCRNHIQSHPNFDPEKDGHLVPKETTDPDIIPQDLLRKYIVYSREKVFPKVSGIDQQKLERLYSDLRYESMATGGIPITVRYLESLIRMSEAFARMSLRDYVRQDDVDRSISMMVTSFVSSQKYSIRKQMERAFQKYLSYEHDSSEFLFHILSELVSESYRYSYYSNDKYPDKIEIPISEFENQARSHRLYDLSGFYKSQCFLSKFNIDTKRQTIVKTF